MVCLLGLDTKKASSGASGEFWVLTVFTSVFDSGWTFLFHRVFLFWVHHWMRNGRFTVVGDITIRCPWSRAVLHPVDPEVKKYFYRLWQKIFFGFLGNKSWLNELLWLNINDIIIRSSWEFSAEPRRNYPVVAEGGRFVQRACLRAVSKRSWWAKSKAWHAISKTIRISIVCSCFLHINMSKYVFLSCKMNASLPTKWHG